MSQKPQITSELRIQMVDSAKSSLNELVGRLKPHEGVTIMPIKETRGEVVKSLNRDYQQQFELRTGKETLQILYQEIVEDAAEELGIERHSVKIRNGAWGSATDPLWGDILPEGESGDGIYWVKQIEYQPQPLLEEVVIQ